MANFNDALSFLGYFKITTTKDPNVSANLGYINPGTDSRIAGKWGEVAGRFQSASAYKSANPPVVMPVQRLSGVYLQTQYDPDRPHNARYALAVRKSTGGWITLRLGYTYDPNWGDARTVGYNPNPEIIGGYFLDIIPKFDSDRSFIDGVE